MKFNAQIKSLVRQLQRAIRILQVDGPKTLLKLIYHKCFRLGVPVSIPLLGKNKILNFYNYVNKDINEKNEIIGVLRPKTINWFIPPFGFGSGGHTTIFRAINFLEQQGYICNIVIVGEPRPVSAEAAKKQINEWFFPLKAEVYLDVSLMPAAQIAMATSWQTAYFVRNYNNSRHKCYFVQDYEPSFYAMGSEYIWAEETYRFGFKAITAGDWLKTMMISKYGMEAVSFGFSYEKEFYKPLPKPNGVGRNVFFYARPPTQRRGFELGMLVLQEVVKRLPDIGVVFAGWDISNYEIPFKHKNAGTVSREELPVLFSECDVALVLSLTNLSLLPLELMACGVPVVSNQHPCAEWMLNENNACLAKPTVESLADGICKVLNSEGYRQKLISNGLNYAGKTDWNVEFEKVSNYLDSLIK